MTVGRNDSPLTRRNVQKNQNRDEQLICLDTEQQQVVQMGFLLEEKHRLIITITECMNVESRESKE